MKTMYSFLAPVLRSLLVASITLVGFSATAQEAAIRKNLAERLPNFSKIDEVKQTAMPGLYEVRIESNLFYTDAKGDYLIQGELMDVAARKNLSDVALSKVRGEVLKTLPLADRIVFSPTGTPKHKVVVLTDIECGYCRKFHNDIGEYTKRGIQVEYLAFPRAGLGSPDYRKMVSVWCADDRKKALTDAKNDRAVPSKTCKTPVDMQYNAGVRMGLEGTPMILTTDGQFLGGYLPPDALRQRLDQVDAERGKAAGGA